MLFLKSKTKFFPLCFCLVLGIYTHYFFVIMLATLNLYLILQKEISKKWLVANVIVTIACLPLIYLILNTPKFQAPPYQSLLKFPVFYLTSLVPWDFIQNLQIYLLNILDLTSILAIILSLISFSLLLTAIIKVKKTKTIKFIIFVYISGPILIMTISYLVTPIAALRSFVIFLPFYLLLVAIFLSSLKEWQKVFTLILLTCLSLLLWASFLFGKNQTSVLYQELYQNTDSETLTVYNDITLFLPSQILEPNGQHLLIFPGHLRPITYQALGIKIVPFSDIPQAKNVRYAKLLTRWPQFEKEADQLEIYLKNNYQEINRQIYHGWQLISFQKP